MTLTQTIIKILADGVPRTADELMEITGKSRDKVHVALSQLRRVDRLKAEPVRYDLTEKGRERANWKPKTPNSALTAQARSQAKAVVKKAIVKTAIANRHPLAVVWGGANA